MASLFAALPRPGETGFVNFESVEGGDRFCQVILICDEEGGDYIVAAPVESHQTSGGWSLKESGETPKDMAGIVLLKDQVGVVYHRIARGAWFRKAPRIGARPFMIGDQDQIRPRCQEAKHARTEGAE